MAYQERVIPDLRPTHCSNRQMVRTLLYRAVQYRVPSTTLDWKIYEKTILYFIYTDNITEI